jgi:ElaB/YqjD/DUF883 family membrane-anchored ribosome-binding protein
MEKSTEVRRDVDNLKDDATSVMAELSEIARSLRETGKEWTKELRDELGNRIDRDVETIKRKLGEIEELSKEYLTSADRHVRTNPYYYIAGSLGLGVLIGKFFLRSSRNGE